MLQTIHTKEMNSKNSHKEILQLVSQRSYQIHTWKCLPKSLGTYLLLSQRSANCLYNSEQLLVKADKPRLATLITRPLA